MQHAVARGLVALARHRCARSHRLLRRRRRL